jgi:hypothetical protein
LKEKGHPHQSKRLEGKSQHNSPSSGIYFLHGERYIQMYLVLWVRHIIEHKGKSPLFLPSRKLQDIRSEYDTVQIRSKAQC